MAIFNYTTGFFESSSNQFKQAELCQEVSKRKIHFFSTELKFHYDEDDFNTEYKMCEWLDKNTTGKWGVEFLRIGFELEQDAIIYRLRFGK